MAVIDTINVGGADYSIQDATARTKAEYSYNLATTYGIGGSSIAGNVMYGTTFTNALASGYAFVWAYNQKPDYGEIPLLCHTTRAVSAGELIKIGTNCERDIVEWQLDRTRVYVGSDNKLHYVNYRGADTALNFNGGGSSSLSFRVTAQSGGIWGVDPLSQLNSIYKYAKIQAMSNVITSGTKMEFFDSSGTSVRTVTALNQDVDLTQYSAMQVYCTSSGKGNIDILLHN